jgi:transcriptional regulator with PAS, ATPase and Fis domain
MIRLQEILKKVDVFLYPEDSLRDAAEKLLRSPSEAIPVVDPRGTFLGAVTRDHLLQMVLRKLPLHAPIQDHFPQDDSFAVQNPSWEKILEKMVNSQVETVFVLNREGQVTGSLSRSDLLRTLFSRCRMMERILEQGSDGWFLVNEEEKMVFANQNLLGLMACSGKEWLGKPIGQLLPGLKLKDMMKTGKAEVSGWLEANGIRYLVHGCPVFENGKVAGVAGKVIYRHWDQIKKRLEQLDEGQTETGGKKQAKPSLFTWKQVIGRDPEVERLKRCARKAAAGDSTILIRGESGTGKELVAHAIHGDSPRRNGPFVTVNCAAVPEHLMEAEFFGYDEGAFTGAGKKGKPGKLELADGGTLFLDEIGDMSLKLQAKLLRVLEEKSFYRVGGTRRIDTDVRIIAATNQCLEEMIRKGTFREDLFYRLNVIALNIPPLRKRKQDILPLCRHFVKELNQKLMTAITGIDPEVEQILLNYHWQDLPSPLRDLKETACQKEDGLLKQAEKNAICQALLETGGNKVKAARLLGISRSVLYEKLKKYELSNAF